MEAAMKTKAASPYILAIGLLLAVSISAPAQQQRMQPRHPPPPPASPPVVAGPTLPSAPAALAVPNPFGPPPGTLDLYRRPDNFHNLVQQPFPIFFPGPSFFPGYGVGGPDPFMQAPFGPSGSAYYPQALGDSRQLGPLRTFAKGGLRLETEPGTAQVFVDGYYAGLVEDYGLRGRILELPAGSHHIELRAPGYALLAFDVNIIPNETSRFRGDLQLVPPQQRAPSATTASAVIKKFYVIPNCYAGDRPPTGTLPAGCDRTKMREVR
jgi:hypothetical protein